MTNDVVIVGAGHAGGMTAISLRQNKFQGSITIIGNESYIPYQRPALSKGFLEGSTDKKRLFLKTEKYYKDNNIKILLNRNVEDINNEKHTLITDHQEEVKYKKLVFATGSIPNRIKTSEKIEDLYYLRSIEDSVKIKNILTSKKEIVILGAGYIGLEIASVITKKDIGVTIIEAQNRIMERVLCPVAAQFFYKKHKANGVKFKFNKVVCDIENYQDQKKILTSKGNSLLADAVIIGIGVKPNINLALKAGLACEDGIVVDENGLTSEKNIFAVGDCTNHPNNILHKRLRLESVHNAVEQSKTVASFICGNLQPYRQVPWFWSDQYDLKLQIAGQPLKHDDYLIRGAIQNEKFSIFYMENKRLTGVVAINSPKDFMLGKKLIAKDQNFSASYFSDNN